VTPEQLQHFKQKLQTMRTELLREQDASAATGQPVDTREGDQSDQASAETDRDLAGLNRERIRMLLAQVDAALVRIENGTYGICEDTGEPIGLKRLEAQPTATLSVEALEKRERAAR